MVVTANFDLIPALRNKTKLRELEMSVVYNHEFYPQITPRDQCKVLNSLIVNLPHLEKLDLMDCDDLQYDLDGLSIFPGLSQLEELCVGDCLVNDAVPQANSDSCLKLRVLEIYSYEGLSLSGLKKVLSKFPIHTLGLMDFKGTGRGS